MDRIIEVRTADEGIWLLVKWDQGLRWFEVVDKDTWVLPVELDAWREAPHPAIPGVGAPQSA